MNEETTTAPAESVPVAGVKAPELSIETPALEYDGTIFRVGMRVSVQFPKKMGIDGTISLLKTSGWVGIDEGNGRHTEGFLLPYIQIR